MFYLVVNWDSDTVLKKITKKYIIFKSVLVWKMYLCDLESTIESLICSIMSSSHMFPWRLWTWHPTPSLRSKQDPFPRSNLNTCKIIKINSNCISNYFRRPSTLLLFVVFFLRNLSNNKISVLEPDCFENISSTLLVLKLNRNRLVVLPSRPFKLPQLQFL